MIALFRALDVVGRVALLVAVVAIGLAIVNPVFAAMLLPPAVYAGAWWILHRASGEGVKIAALLDRLRVAQCGLLGSLIIDALAVNGFLGRPIPIVPPTSTYIVAAALLIMAAPTGYFLWLFATDRFGDGET